MNTRKARNVLKCILWAAAVDGLNACPIRLQALSKRGTVRPEAPATRKTYTLKSRLKN